MRASLLRPLPHKCSRLFERTLLASKPLMEPSTSFPSSAAGVLRDVGRQVAGPTSLPRQHGTHLLSTAAQSSGAASAATTSTAPSCDTPPPHLLRIKSNFCRVCGSPVKLQRVGDVEVHCEWRHVCSNPACGTIDYHNPRIVVGCIVEHEGQILLCRRAIEPAYGKWTIPAGFMELGESSVEGAARETLEEANAHVQVLAPYAFWDIPVIGQAYVLFRAQLNAPFTHSAGPESLETALVSPANIPWDNLAFSSVSLSLRLFLEDMTSGRYRVHQGVIEKRPGGPLNDPATFFLRDHLALEVSGVPVVNAAKPGSILLPGAGQAQNGGEGQQQQTTAQSTSGSS